MGREGVSRWRSARALPRGSPPPPGDFSFSGNGEISKDSSSSQNSHYQSLKPASLPTGFGVLVAQCNFSETVPRVLTAAGKLERRTQDRSGGGRGKVKGPSLPKGALSLQRRSCFREYASTPSSPFQVELVSGNPARSHRNLPFPHVPSGARASEDARKERTDGRRGRRGPGHHQASADPSPSPVEKGPLLPAASLPFTPTVPLPPRLRGRSAAPGSLRGCGAPAP